jgi:hypothetical protein
MLVAMRRDATRAAPVSPRDSRAIVALPPSSRATVALSPRSLAALPSQVEARRAPLVRSLLGGILEALPQILSLLLAYRLYQAISAAVPRQPALAHQHAAMLVGAERWLGLLVEPDVQHLTLHPAAFGPSGALGGEGVRQLVILIYAGGHLPWLLSMLLWLYLF